jgi:hypothetical protein
MHRRFAARSMVLVIVVPLVAAACGDPDQASTASPMNAIFGEPLSPAEERTRQLRQEEVVAECMRAEGWEYTPIDWMAQFNNQPEPDDFNAPDYGQKYGYGIVRSYELYEWPYLDDEGNWTDVGPGGGFEDPNQDYVTSLTQDEQEQYYEALSGPPFEGPTNTVAFDEDAPPDTIFVAPSLEEQGCYGKAQLEVYGEQPWNDQDFNTRMGELQEELNNDPEIYDAEVVWSDCMYELNPDYDFGGPDDTYLFVSDELEAAKGGERVDVDPNTGEVIGQPGVYPENGWQSNEDGSEAWGYVGKRKKLTEAEIEEVRKVELELWKADQECQKETGLGELRRQREQEMVDTLREEFPEFIEQANG